MAILVEKAECFESNDYRTVLTRESNILLNWYGIEKKVARKEAEKVALWREMRAASTDEPPTMADVWTAKDKEELVKLRNKEIDMSETYLRRYAAIQKRNATSALFWILPTRNDWESLKTLREADRAEKNQVAMVNDTGDMMGSLLGTENENETAGCTIDQGAA
jgi:hypothetical protein